MYRQSPSRNQRSKAIRVKTVLQICLLIAVSFWLIYQVKYSHDKKKELDESDAKTLLHRTGSDEVIKLGRKDIQPRVVETITKHENHDEPLDEDEKAGEEIEENKHEEDEPEKKKVEGTEDDDETDEHEQENSDAEVDREHDLVTAEDKEDGDENETQETDSEDGHDQFEKESAVDDTDHDADDRSTHEAREEHYKADDASSAVTHDTPLATTERENKHVENSDKQTEIFLDNENKESNSGETYESENRRDLEVEGGEVDTEGYQSNVTTSETKVDMFDDSENGSSPNKTITERLYDHSTSNSTTEVTIEHHDLPTENVTKSEPELGQGSDLQTIDSERPENSALNMATTRSDSSSTGSAETKDTESLSELSDSSNNSTDSSTSETLLRSEASMQAGNNTESSSEKNDEVEDEKSEIRDGTDKNLESTLTENPEEFQQDAIDISDTSNSMEEKDVRMDLDTLPEIQTGGTNIEDAAAE